MLDAVVFGNGESRLSINPEDYKTNHITFGCNAIQRDITVDHLICCDRRMVEESISNLNNQNTLIYVRPEWYQYFKKIKKLKNIKILPEIPYEIKNKQDEPRNWGSGCYAILLAASLGYEKIKLIGFDLYSKDAFVNNVYKGTTNYADMNSQSVDPNYWIYQIGKVFSNFPDSHFIIYNYRDWKFPREWQKNNVSFVEL